MSPGAEVGQSGVGIGLRAAHHGAFLSQSTKVDFVEVHAENFMAAGGAARALLRQVRQKTSLSLHAVGLGLGSAVGIDEAHLAKLAELVREFDPLLVSDHACFCRAQLPGRNASSALPQTLPVHGADLLPLAFTRASLHILSSNVQRVQDALQRRLLVENLSAYLQFEDSTLVETDFLAELCKRTGCGLLLDANNLVVNAINAGAEDPAQSACAWVDALAQHQSIHIGEIHLAGHRAPHATLTPDQPKLRVIDDHSQCVNDSVWQVHDHALRYWPHAPRLVEWDVDLPSFDTLLAQADMARERGAKILRCA